jgi:hypothetical protein
MTVTCLIKISLKATEKNHTYSGSVAKNRTQEERTVRVRTCKLLKPELRKHRDLNECGVGVWEAERMDKEYIFFMARKLKLATNHVADK